MKIHELLTPDTIALNFTAPPGETLPTLLALVKSGGGLETEPAGAGMEAPEMLHAYKGEGLAILHNLTEAVAAPFLFLALAPQGVELDGGTCRILAVLLSPLRESGSHLQTLSRLQALLHHREVGEELLTKNTPAEVIRAIRLQEKSGPEKYWVLSREEILTELESRAEGLAPAEVQLRLTEAGPNRIARLRRRPLVLRLAANLVNLFALLLWAASGFAYLAGMVELAWAIPVVILINAVFSFWQEFRAEKAIEALARLLPLKTRVLRQGLELQVEAHELVPGDIIRLESGDQVPADARLIQARDFRVDHSALTGESRPAYKFAEAVAEGQEFLWMEMPNLVFAGTAVLSGVGLAVVIATGMDTQLGNIASLTQRAEAKTSPLERQLQGVARVVAVVACSIGLTFFLVGLLTGKLAFLASLIFAIGMIVAFVPEGLLPTLSLSLAVAAQRLAAKKALVKQLSAVETLGAATVICTDKTGTLTTNEVMVARLWLGGELYEVTGTGYQLQGRLEVKGRPLTPDQLHSPLLELFATCASLCNTASLGQEDLGPEGDPTEAALLVLAAKAGRDFRRLRREQPQLQVHAFESVRKRMSTINAQPDGNLRCWVKGAPETLLPLCQTYTDWQGKEQHLNSRDRGQLIQVLHEMGQKGLRVLALAWKKAPSPDLTQAEAESGLSLLGITGMLDPPRPEVPQAIQQCHTAGLRIIMVTGDFGGTALAVAQGIGLRLERRLPVITGEQLSRLSEVEVRQLLKRRHDMIFARISPEQKLLLVNALHNLGQVVAVTGDGVNDGPALKAADIGVAMGRRGTEVSKEAASLVLAEDNFTALVAAVEEGRAVYANIKKFITYIFASNVAEAVPFILFVLAGIPLPLHIMQILAVDLGADLLPALALGCEPPEPGLMQQPPRSRQARLIDTAVAWRCLFLGLLTAAAGLSAYFFVYLAAGWRPGLPLAAAGPLYERATTMCYGGIICAAAGNALALRTDLASIFRLGLRHNPLLAAGLATVPLILLCLSYVPFLQQVFHTAPLLRQDLLFLLLVAPLPLLADEARKAWQRWSRSRKKAGQGRGGGAGRAREGPGVRES